MVIDDLSDIQRIDAETRRAYRQMVGVLVSEAERLQADGRYTDADEVSAHAMYCTFMAQGMTARTAEALTVRFTRPGWTKERPRDPEAMAGHTSSHSLLEEATLFEAVESGDKTDESATPILDELQRLRIKEPFRSMSDREFEAIALTAGRGMTHREAAEVMGVKVSTVDVLIANARKRFTPIRDDYCA